MSSIMIAGLPARTWDYTKALFNDGSSSNFVLHCLSWVIFITYVRASSGGDTASGEDGLAVHSTQTDLSYPDAMFLLATIYP